MEYGVVVDVPASWFTYERIAAELGGTPTGVIVRAAGPTDEGFRLIDVWQSEGEWRSFSERLLPLLGEAVDIGSIRVRGNPVKLLQTHEVTAA